MLRKKNDSEITLLLRDASDVQSKVKGRSVQSSMFGVLLGFINIYVMIGFVMYLLVKGNLINGINTDFLDQGYIFILDSRVNVVLVFLMILNISAYYNYGFKYLGLILSVYMLNSAIDTIILFSDFAQIAERPYFWVFQLSRPLFIICLVWITIIHKDNIKDA